MPDGVNPLVAMALTLALGFAIYWFWPRAEVWSGTIYPEAGTLLIYEHIGEFPSPEECRAASLRRLQDFEDPVSLDYECGLNCTPYRERSDLLVCEETRR